MTQRAAEIILPLHQFSTDDYHSMSESGLFEGKRVELLEGRIIDMAPVKSKHASVVKLLNNWLRSALSDQYTISVQDPISLSKYSEPEPDLAVLDFREDYYAKAHPQPKDIHLLIEVADTSLDKDQKVKLPLYAAAGIPEVWIVNLPEQQLEQYTEPSTDGYRLIRIFRAGDTLERDWIGALEVGRLFGG
ncbi:MAG: Uma2 family endonuclease [Phaeodactylibacter xiamenensis]|uniref:Uma2 family endonuclease n=1 Tax=Phaeodactylibacter xiamenensis TaxID=1524460 RepID=UPI0005C6334B|nr:Uma2 family endonuclease [Phaeodactylibacter xiamenensis]MCR9054508.1 Uma2 family endonuclease [bacterium]